MKKTKFEEGGIYDVYKITLPMEKEIQSLERKLETVTNTLNFEKQTVKLLLNIFGIIVDFTEEQLTRDLIENVIEQVRLAKLIDMKEESNETSEKGGYCTSVICGEHQQLTCDLCKAKMRLYLPKLTISRLLSV